MSTDQEHIRFLQRELLDAQQANRQIKESTSYQLGRLIVESSRSWSGAIRLPFRLFRLVRSRRSRVAPSPQNVEMVRTALHAWAQEVTAQHPSHLVFMFSGTTYIQGVRGNRPIRLSLALDASSVPVIYGFHRFREEGPEQFAEGTLLQVPNDVGIPLAGEICSLETTATHKIFVISYPHPDVVDRIEMFRKAGWRIVYDCRDDWEEFEKVGMARWYDRSVERRVVQGSDTVTCVSGPLSVKMREVFGGKDVRVFPNAVESEFVGRTYRRLPASNPRVVGYFGHLSSAWFDWASMIQIAERCPQLHFEIIGHSEPADLKLPGNMELKGPKPWSELGEFAQRWSAAIIPFKMNTLADGVDPIKVYEYLAFGLPVVSFRMPQIESYPYTVTVNSVEQFCTALEKAVHVDVDSKAIADFLSKNTWETRAQEFLRLAEEQTC